MRIYYAYLLRVFITRFFKIKINKIRNSLRYINITALNTRFYDKNK